MGVQVAGAFAKVRGNLALDLGGLDEVALVVDLLDHPYVACQGDALAHGRRLDDRAEFLRITADGILLILLEDRVELEIVDDPLACEADDEPARLGALDLVAVEQVTQQHAIVVEAHAVDRGERKHALSQRSRRELARRSKGAHGLMVQEAEGQPVEPRRFDPVFFPVKLDQRNGLEEFPGNGLGQERARLRFILPDDEPHLGRHAPPARAPHALQERRDRPGCIDLERPFQPSDVDAELQGGCRHRGQALSSSLISSSAFMRKLAERLP